jgi:hypothetical protein
MGAVFEPAVLMQITLTQIADHRSQTALRPLPLYYVRMTTASTGWWQITDRRLRSTCYTRAPQLTPGAVHRTHAVRRI